MYHGGRKICSWDKLHNNQYLMLLMLNLKYANFQVSSKKICKNSKWLIHGLVKFESWHILGSRFNISSIEYWSLYHTWTKPTNQIARFGGYNGSYIPQNSSSIGTIYPCKVGCMTHYIPWEGMLLSWSLETASGFTLSSSWLHSSNSLPEGYNGSYIPLYRDISYTYATCPSCISSP